MNNAQKAVFILSVLILLSFIVSMLVGSTAVAPKNTDEGLAVCTADARQCPDGSYVGRQGPDCAFAPCTVDREVTPRDTIDLSYSELTKVPTSIFSKTDTVVLNLSGNILTSLPAEIHRLEHLRTLNLSNNRLTDIPAELGRLSNLEILDLSNNSLTGLPYELGNLKNLKILDLRGNNYAVPDLEIIQQSLPISTHVLTE